MTCKQTTKLKIVDLPSRALWDDVEKQLYRRAKALRRQRISKLAPFIPTVRHCLSKGYSLQRISLFLEFAHGCKADKSTVWRFVAANPILKQCHDDAQSALTLASHDN